MHWPVYPSGMPCPGTQISAQMFQVLGNAFPTQGVLPQSLFVTSSCLPPARPASPSKIVSHPCLLGQRLSESGDSPAFLSGACRTRQSVWHRGRDGGTAAPEMETQEDRRVLLLALVCLASQRRAYAFFRHLDGHRSLHCYTIVVLGLAAKQQYHLGAC